MEENVTITFKDIDDDEATHRLNALKYIEVLDEIRQWLRNKWKYSDERMVHIDKLYEEFFEIIESNGIKLL